MDKDKRNSLKFRSVFSSLLSLCYVLFCPLVALLLYSPLNAQSNGGKIVFDVETIVANKKEKVIDIFMAAYEHRSDGSFEGLVVANPKQFIITETIDGESLKMPIRDVSYISEKIGYTKNMIYIMLEVSGSMNKKGYTTAKALIQKLFQSNSLASDGSQDIHVVWFNKGLLTKESFKLEKGYDSFIEIEDMIMKNPFPSTANLNQSLKGAIAELQKATDSKKTILLFTDGHSISTGEEDFNNLMSSVRSVSNDFQFHIIGVGETVNQSALDSICQVSISPKDLYSRQKLSRQVINSLLSKQNEPIENLKITVSSSHEILGNEVRKYSIEYLGDRRSKVIKEAVFSPSSSIADIRAEQLVELSFEKTLIYGLGIILGLLGVFSIAIPLFNQFHFKQNHVKKYSKIKKEGVTTLDPLTMQQIEDDEMVVVMGNRIMSLDTWKYMRENGQGETAKDYADFFERQLSGNFFSQRGIFQRLNWLWFGLLGGFVSWGLNVLLGQVHVDFYMNLLKTIFDTPVKQVSTAIYSGTMTGLSLGFGICSTLALVDELGQSRKFDFLRILKRIVLGMLIAIPVFLLESYLTTVVLNYNYLGGLIGWTIFGTAIGFVVTLFSIIEKKNGLIGGFIAGVIAFHFYYLLQYTPQIIGLLNSEFTQMVSFILYGGLLGYILFTIVSRLEDFELVYLSPQAFNGQVKAISKWLKSPAIDAIYIGTDPNCEVYIKWADQDTHVKEKHARMTYENGEVFIESIGEAEVLVNNLVIREKKSLADNDKILLGSQSISLIQFNSKNNKEEKKPIEEKKTKQIAVKVIKKSSS